MISERQENALKCRELQCIKSQRDPAQEPWESQLKWAKPRAMVATAGEVRSPQSQADHGPLTM